MDRIPFINSREYSDLMEEIKGRYPEMGKTLMQIMQPEIDVVVKDAVTTARADEHEKTTRTNLYIYVQRGGMSVDFAAHEAGMSTSDFSTAMTNAGYKLPQLMNQ